MTQVIFCLAALHSQSHESKYQFPENRLKNINQSRNGCHLKLSHFLWDTRYYILRLPNLVRLLPLLRRRSMPRISNELPHNPYIWLAFGLEVPPNISGTLKHGGTAPGWRAEKVHPKLRSFQTSHKSRIFSQVNQCTNAKSETILWYSIAQVYCEE